MNSVPEVRGALLNPEEQREASEARFRTFVDHATDAFFLHGPDCRVVDVNRQACVNLGYSRDELIGLDGWQVAARLRELGADLPILLMSGYNASQLPASAGP